MRSYASMLALIEELNGDAREIERLKEQNARAWLRIEQGADDPIDWGALGFTIQTIYGVLENYFLRISKYFENSLPADRWHQALVDKMRLDIEGVRPALLTDDDSASQVKELVRFRHRLRNLYGEDLNPKRTREIQQVVESFFGRFPKLHGEFVAKLRDIANAL